MRSPSVPAEAETAALLATVAELLFSRGEFVYARRYLDWAQRVTCNPALILRLAGLAFELQFIQGAAVRSGMVLRLVKEFGQHDPAYAARLLSAGSLYYAERWELDDALSLLQQMTGLPGRRLQRLPRRGRIRSQTHRRDQGQHGASSGRREAGGARLATLLVEGRALSYAGHHGAAREAYAIVRNSSEAGDFNWRQTAEYLAVDNEIRAGNIRKAVLLIDRLDNRPAMNYHRGMRHIFRVWRAHSLGDEARAQTLAADAQHFAGEESHPAITAQLAACQGQFA